MRLTQRLIDRRGLAPGRYDDDQCKTLRLHVSRRRSASWIQRLTVDSKRRDIGLGGAACVPLSEARMIATANRIAARRGEPVKFKRAAAQVPTFGMAAAECERLNTATWADSSLRSWRVTMTRYLLPALETAKLANLTRERVVEVLNSIPKDAERKKARMRCRMALSVALSRRWVAVNVADGIDQALRKTNGKTKHHDAMPHAECGAFLRGLPESTTADALRFLVLTVARSAEVRGATWDEVDLDGAVWTVPASRMKTKREHSIPLSPAAVAILRRQGTTEGLVFRSPMTGRRLSSRAWSKTLPAGCTPHGYRSAFRDWASEKTDHPRDVIEAALAHKNGTNATEAAYFRTTLFDRRRALMVEWAAYVRPDSV